MIFSSSLYLKFRKRIYPLILAMVICFPVKAQQYNGMTGLIHIPSAEMGRPGDAHIGVHFVNKELMPDKFVCPDDDGNLEKYNSYSYYLNITPFNWLEVAYTCVLFKYNQPNRKGYKAKDRHFCIKVNPLKETKYTHCAICEMPHSFEIEAIVSIKESTSDNTELKIDVWNEYIYASSCKYSIEFAHFPAICH